MTKQNHTKRALCASILSLIICISMLVGSTFAWFTDTASTGVNTIVSGNLDIALYKGELNAEKTAISYENEVTAATKLFDDEALWEPGYTEVAYLKIANIGNLALKYQLTVNVINEVIGESVLGNEIKLSEVLKYDLVEIGATDFYADRATAIADIETPKNLVTETYSGIMEPTDTKYYALVVYMPTSVGNEANHLIDTTPPSIQLGINLVATQYTSESDSFDNQYDKDAIYPLVATANVVSGEDTVIKASTAEATIPAEVSAAVNATSHTLTIEKKDDVESNVTITGSGLAYDVEITNIPTDNEEVIEVNWYIGTGANITSLYHSTVKMELLSEKPTSDYTADTYYYNTDTGYLTIYVTHFSEFALDIEDEVRVGDVYYDLISDVTPPAWFQQQANYYPLKDGDTVTVLKDITSSGITQLSSNLAFGNDVTLDLNGCTLTLTGTQGYISANNNFTITDSSDEKTGEIIGSDSINASSKVINVAANKTFTLNGGTIEIVSAASGKDINIVTLNKGSVFTMNGGFIYAQSTDEYSDVACVDLEESSIFNLNGGTLEAKGTNTTGIITAVSMLAQSSMTERTFNMTGGKINVSDYSSAVYVGATGVTTAAKIDISGGTITANGIETRGILTKLSGTSDSAIVQVNVSDNACVNVTTSSENSQKVFACFYSEVIVNTSKCMSLNISGGKFSYIGTGEAASGNVIAYLKGGMDAQITGGTFSSDPSDYVDTDTYSIIETNGSYSVAK